MTAFRDVPRTGVIYVMHRATERGFHANRGEWANLGQGAPECGPLPGAPPRRVELALEAEQNEYGPVGGVPGLRQRVAEYYNELYRTGCESKYTAANVCIAPGGRAAMTRIAAAVGHVNLGHFIPDYTAYEELLTTFHGFVPIPILLDPDAGYRISLADLEREIVGRGLALILRSNPCNPTGQLLEGEELAGWVRLARDSPCTMVFDEFYSHYIYADDASESVATNSAAAHVDDVDEDPILIVDGLTKNWRYPGWRVSWVVGPRGVIECVNSAGSFLDGGANQPFQHVATRLLDTDLARQETTAIQRVFRQKRQYMLERLGALGIDVDGPCRGAFYAWGSVAGLPDPLNDGFAFFEAGLDERVITVPGVFFDVNPGQRRRHSGWRSHVRFSFGPPMHELVRGLDAIERVISRYR